MKRKPDFELFKAVAKHQEAGRVPLLNATPGRRIMEKFLGREITPVNMADRAEFCEKFGFDFVCAVVSLLKPGKVDSESKISRVLKEMVLAKNPNETDPTAWNLEVTAFIHERKDFYSFPWDAAEIDYTELDTVRPHLPEKAKVVALSGKIFTLSWMLMGFQNFMFKLIDDPVLVRNVVEKISEIQLGALETILNRDYVGAVWFVDDLGFGSGPMISPDTYREFIFTKYKKAMSMCHESDKLVIFHSDGEVTKLMPDLIDMGVDILQPIDPTCMDIFKVKKEFGSQISLAGNVPNERLQLGTPDEIEAYTMKLLKECGPGGGYFLGSGNSLPDWSKYENVMALRDTGLKYGNYPISL